MSAVSSGNTAQCEFCQIVAGESPAEIVCETPDALAFFPLRPAADGHTLLIPKRHVPDLWSLDDETATMLARLIVPLSTAIRAAVKPDGFNVINSSGEAA